MAVVKRDRPGPVKKRKAVKKSDVEAERYTLPGEMTEPVSDLGDAVIMIFGVPKVGKTSLASQFGKTLVLATEVGYKGLRLFKEDVDSWNRAKLVLRALKKDKSFKTACIDTIDRLYLLSERETCQQLGIEELADAEWGKGFSSNRKRLSGYLNDIAATGKGLILTSHAQEREVRSRTGGTFDRIVPTMPKQAREIVEAMVDIWGYYQHDGRRRVLQIIGDDQVAAGHRFEDRFRTPDGQRLKFIDMGRNAQEAYRNFVAAFNNRYEPTKEDDVIQVKKKLKLKKR